MVRGALYATAQGCDDLGELLNRLNRQICGETLPSEFVTLLVIAVDVERRLLGYASAGHEPLLLMRQGVVREYGNGSMVLGIDATETYREYRVELQTGDMILLYTDGLVEAMNFSGELFGRGYLRPCASTGAWPWTRCSKASSGICGASSAWPSSPTT